MRQRGSRTTVGGLGRQDHGCLVHQGDAVLAEAAVTFLHDGLRLGQRLMYVGTRPAILDGLGDVDALREAGILELTGAPYGGLDPDRLEAHYDAAITRALADGFTGLRTFAEMDVGAPADDLIRWEARADRMMAERPWSAVCAYDGRRDAGGVLADVATVHPLDCGAGDSTSFHLVGTGRHALALTGAVDTFGAEDLERRLRAAAPPEPATVDLSELEFADHAAVLALGRVRADTGLTCTGTRFIVQRVADLVGVEL